ncbi:hypothetical protein [Crateriforma conspicua]|uniref:Uncharacterized protein n=1 Tax=Crateriforma conspicua TaxID=2527996 RepID=A0A5C6FDV3_9PLAN|nr:hypothetical protein [Crateriforma conspicua]TWU59623.1 hypothetical protein V7x_55330 [Crateriforma conspicua]
MKKYRVERDTSENDDFLPFEETIEAANIEEAAQEWVNRRLDDGWHANHPGEPFYDVIVTTSEGETKKVQVEIDHNDLDGDFAEPCFVC